MQLNFLKISPAHSHTLDNDSQLCCCQGPGPRHAEEAGEEDPSRPSDPSRSPGHDLPLVATTKQLCPPRGGGAPDSSGLRSPGSGALKWWWWLWRWWQWLRWLFSRRWMDTLALMCGWCVGRRPWGQSARSLTSWSRHSMVDKQTHRLLVCWTTCF